MKININDVSKLEDIKKALKENRVSDKTINVIEKALQSGFKFRSTDDFSIFSLTAADVGILRDLVVFEPTGNPATGSDTVFTYRYFFKPVGNANYFHSYQFIISYTQTDGLRVSEAFPIEDNRMVIVDLDHSEIASSIPILYQVKSATGEITEIRFQNSPDFFEQLEVKKNDLKDADIEVKVLELNLPENPELIQTYQIKGKLIIMDEDKLDGYKIVIMAATETNSENQPEYIPVAFTNSESNGYFITSHIHFPHAEDLYNVIAAKALISKDEEHYEFPVKLVKTVITPPEGDVIQRTMLPRRLIIVIDKEAEGDKKDCGCGDCNELNFLEKKVFEEFDYYSIVRTTEPAIIADVIEEEEEIDLNEIFGDGGKVPLSVLRDYLGKVNFFAQIQENDNSGVIRSAGGLNEARSIAATLSMSMVLNKDLLKNLLVKHKIGAVVKGKNKRQYKGRSYLNPQNQIDWDEEPTIYQAASIAHGHLLHFKQEWIPDGYSIGDLLYSLPLAPGQKKQIAVLDWARRESAASSQQLDYQEVLNNSLVRDRDISEVVSATLSESIEARSSSRTTSFAGGVGGAIIEAFTGGLASGVLGISGGTSNTGTSAGQNSSRQSAASSLQRLRDRTSQASSFVRSQRATVIQTVS